MGRNEAVALFDTTLDHRPHHKTTGVVDGVERFLHGTAYTAVQKPIDGLTQLANHIKPGLLPHLQLVDAAKEQSVPESAGELVGTVVDFIILQKLLGKAAPGLFGAKAATPMWLKMGATGAAYESMMPVQENGNYFLDKARNVAISAGTFAAMGAISDYVGPKAGNSFVGKVMAGGEGGLAGGEAEVGLRDLLYQRKPTYEDLKTIGKYTAFGAMVGAADYAETALRDKLNVPGDPGKGATPEKETSSPTAGAADDAALEKSVQTNRNIFSQAADSNEVLAAKKQLYEVKFRKVTDAAGEKIPTLENPAGEPVQAGQWVAQRLDAHGQPVIERGQLNQWPMNEAKIAKTYQVDPQTLATQTEFVAPTRVDGPIVHMVQLKEGLSIQTKWGTMEGRPGDWLANYDYDPASKVAGHDYAIVSGPSFQQTYEPAK